MQDMSFSNNRSSDSLSTLLSLFDDALAYLSVILYISAHFEASRELSMFGSLRNVVFAIASAALGFAAAPVHAATPFDGTWAVVLFTKSGSCDQSYRASGEIINGVLHTPLISESNFFGRVVPNGAVSASVSLGTMHGVASGRLSSRSGGGTWRAQLSEGVSCAGTWRASRN
jgi:hypothetical protein